MGGDTPTLSNDLDVVGRDRNPSPEPRVATIRFSQSGKVQDVVVYQGGAL